MNRLLEIDSDCPEYSDDVQETGARGNPAVATSEDGDFVVTWNIDDTQGYGIAARVFDATGNPIGSDFQVNNYITESQCSPGVSIAPNGDFVVVWDSGGSSGSDNDYNSIQAKRYSPLGIPLNSESQVNSHTPSVQQYPSIAHGPDGSFVVAWESFTSPGSDTSYGGILGRQFLADGTAISDDFQINSYTPNVQYRPEVAADEVGNFVVVWQSILSGGNDTFVSVQGRLFSSSGSPTGDDFQVNTYTTGYQYHPSVARANEGEFVVVWQSYGSFGPDDSENCVQARMFDATGQPLGPEFQVNSYSTGHQSYPAVSLNDSGAFLVTWQSEGSHGSDESEWSVQGQLYAPDGSPLGAEFQVNSYTTGPQYQPSVAVDQNGDFIVVWWSDFPQFSIRGRRVGIPVFSDGFESGDTSAWSSTVP